MFKSGYLMIIALIFFSLVLVGVESEAAHFGRMSFLDHATVRFFSPFERIFSRLGNRIGNLVNSETLGKENEQLEEELFLLQRQNSRLRDFELQNREFRGLLGLSQASPRKWLAAEIIGREPSEWFQTVTIDRGEADGVTLDLGVIGIGGVLGKVSEIGEHAARVVLLTDPKLAIPVEILPSGYQGIAYGAGGASCIVKYVPEEAPTRFGDQVVTSGFGHVFERGIPVGSVTQEKADSSGFFKLLLAKPAVHLGKTQTVFVLKP
jgi:rod shape-determining protein MreC